MAKARVVLPRQVIAACNGMGGGIGLGRLVARVLGACRSGEEEGGEAEAEAEAAACGRLSTGGATPAARRAT